jgi:hypothetical protein
MAFCCRSRKWRVALTLFAVFIAYIVVDFFWNGSDVRSNISKETTFVTGPLRKDGYPDYMAALRQRMSKGVTPDNNAAVLFWKAIGSGPIAEKDRDRYFQMLGMAPPPQQGDYFTAHDDFFARQGDENATSSNRWGDSSDPAHPALKRPWSKKEFPALAAWLAANERPLTILVEASKRPRRYDPLVVDEGTPLLAAPRPASPEYKHVAEALVARAMLRTNDGDVDGAWNDLLTCYRLARLEAQDPALIEALHAEMVETMADRGTYALLQYVSSSAARVAKFRKDFEELLPPPQMADGIDVVERCICLDSLALVARVGFRSTGTFTGGVAKSGTSSVWERIGNKTVDWVTICRTHNAYYDRFTQAMRQPTRDDRVLALVKVYKDVRKPLPFRSSMIVNPCGAISVWICQRLAPPLMPPDITCIQFEDYAHTHLDLTRLAFALAQYHAEHGVYPDKLADLTPKYIAKVPKDVFNHSNDFHYRREKSGYLLYSFGINGKDDSGKGYEDRSEGAMFADDIAVRVPVAK